MPKPFSNRQLQRLLQLPRPSGFKEAQQLQAAGLDLRMSENMLRDHYVSFAAAITQQVNKLSTESGFEALSLRPWQPNSILAATIVRGGDISRLPGTVKLSEPPGQMTTGSRSMREALAARHGMSHPQHCYRHPRDLGEPPSPEAQMDQGKLWCFKAAQLVRGVSLTSNGLVAFDAGLRPGQGRITSHKLLAIWEAVVCRSELRM